LHIDRDISGDRRDVGRIASSPMYSLKAIGLKLISALLYTGAGLFVIWRGRQFGLQRARAAEGPPQAT